MSEIKTPEPDLDNFILTSDLGHVGQWEQGVCKRCGEVIKRTQGGDLDDWWHYDFLRMLERHDCEQNKE